MIWFKTRKKCFILSLPTFWFLVQLQVFGLLDRSYGTTEGKSLQKRSTWMRHGESDFDTVDDPYGDRPYYDLKTNLQKGYRKADIVDEFDDQILRSTTGLVHINNLTEDQVKYVGCIDAWYGLVRDQFAMMKFDMAMDYLSCANFCSEYGCQVSLLRGGECKCDYKLFSDPTDYVAPTRCNIPCPVSSSKTFLEDANNKSCGGNHFYSVYCNEVEGETCESQASPTAARVDLSMTLDETVPESRSGSVHMECASCDSSSCNDPGFYSPSYDYFPRNKPDDTDGCVVFCQYNITYIKIDGQNERKEVTRPGTKYALLLWHNDPKFKKPVCQCTDDISNYVEKDPSDCTTPCPGNNSVTCGEAYTGSYPILATIYCANCAQNPTTPPEDNTTGSSTTESDDDTATLTEVTVPITSTTTSTTEVPTTTRGTHETSTTAVTTTSTSEPTTVVTTAKSTTENPVSIDCHVHCFGVEIRTGTTWSACGGEEISHSCGTNSKGTWKWKCLENGHFATDQPDYSDCHSEWIEKIEGDVQKINDTKSALEYLAGVRNGIDEKLLSLYFGHEITNVTGVLDEAVRKAYDFTHSTQEFEKVAVGVIDVTESLIEARKPWLEIDTKSRSTSSTSLLRTIERTSLTLTSKVGLPGGDDSYEKQLTAGSSLDSKYFVSTGIIPKQIGNQSNDPFSFPHARLSHSSYIFLPAGWKTLVNAEKIEHVGHFMNAHIASILLPGQYNRLVSAHTTNDYITNPPNQRVKLINGQLMSLTLGSSSQNSIKSMENGIRMTNGIMGLGDDYDDNRINIRFPGKGVQITFEHDVEAWGDGSVDIRRKLHTGETRKAALGTAQCVYWDTKELVWSTNGCKIVSKTRYRTVCECNHLTSFAVLMDAHNYMGKDMGLEILTLVLCSLSFISLFASILMFAIIRGVQNLRTTITLNLSVCLLLGNTMILLVVDRNYFNLTDDVCVAAGIITHYVFLSAFAWMIIEGLHLYKMVVHVFDTERNPINIYRLMAYGLPLLTVAATVAIGYLMGDRPYGGDVVYENPPVLSYAGSIEIYLSMIFACSCWLEGKYIWSFLVPVAIVVMVNFVILFVALKTAYQLQHNSAIPVHQKRVRSSKTWIKGCFSITVLLGLTWLVGYFTLVPSSPGLIAAYVFTILNASQGIFIFVFHCMLNDKVQAVANKRFGNYLPSWLSVSQDSANETSGFGKRTVSNMQRSNSFSARNPRFCVRAQISLNSTATAGTDGSQSSQGPKCRPKLMVPDADLNRDGVCMDATGGGGRDNREASFVVTPNHEKKKKHLRKRDSSGTITSAEWPPTTANYNSPSSDSDRSYSSLKGLLTFNKPKDNPSNSQKY